VARDRKRSRQRQQRRPEQGAPAAADRKSASSELQRADLPGALEHASGEVDEFDAALIRGAGGVAMPDEAEAAGVSTELETDEDAPGGNGAAAELAPAAGGGGRRGRGRGLALGSDGDGGGGAVAGPERAVERREPKRPLPARAVAFLRASWAELQRVQWPDRAQVSQAVAVVLGFVAVAGVYLGLADWVAQKIVNFIL
jgi:preprotein translocase subunit SecE